MFKFYYILGFLWVVPVSIIGWLFLGLLTLFGQIDCINLYPDLSVVWDLKNTGFFYKKMVRRWFGFVIGCNIVVVDLDDSDKNVRCFMHERRHVLQQYCWGVFFFIAYVFESLRIFLFCKEDHAYLDNRFEIDARKYAGQKIKVPKSEWFDGPEDKWPWW